MKLNFPAFQVLTHILQYLSHGDQFSCSLVSHKFYLAFLDPKITKKIQISWDYCDLSRPLQVFKDSKRIFRLKLGAQLKIDSSIDTSIFENVQELVVECSDGLQLTRFMPNLKSLELRRNTGTRPFNAAQLNGVQSLKISQNFEDFEDLMEVLPNLRSLHLEGFNCKSQKSFNRNSLLSTKTLQAALENRKIAGITLKSYSVEPKLNSEFISSLIFHDLQELALTIDGVEPRIVVTVLQHQDLQVLDLTCWSGFSSMIFQAISTLKTLKSLTLRGKLSAKLVDVSKLQQLRVLRFKDTFDCESSGDHVLGTLKNLTELEIDTKCLNYDQCVEEFVKNNPKLTILNLSKSQIDDLTLEKVFNGFQALRSIVLNDCQKITSLPQLEMRFLEKVEINHCLSLTKLSFSMQNLVNLSMNHLESVSKALTKLKSFLKKFSKNLQNNSSTNLSKKHSGKLAKKLSKTAQNDSPNHS